MTFMELSIEVYGDISLLLILRFLHPTWNLWRVLCGNRYGTDVETKRRVGLEAGCGS